MEYGQGTMIYDNGDEYVGEFETGMKSGQGTYTYADGKVEKGLWEFGEFIGEE